MEIIEKLKIINFENATPDDVRDILYYRTLPAIRSEVTKGTYIVRARRGDGHTKRNEMTYCPVKFCTSLQRATLAGQTMFYGVISDDQSHLEDACAVSISECSKLSREGNDTVGKEKFTLSYWNVIKPFRVVSFIADSTFPQVHDNKLLNELRDVFNGSSFTYQEKELIRFISNEFSKVVKDMPMKALNIADAIGLGVFTSIGATVAVECNVEWYGIIFFGVMTATAGGMIRDTLAGEVPFVLKKEVYASASIAGGILFIILYKSNVGMNINILITSIFVTLIRIVAIYKNWNLPHFKGSE